jgi:hypothetical protein
MMSKKNIAIISVFIVFLYLISSVSGFSTTISRKVSSVVCPFYAAFKSIATGVAALVMVIAGIRWTASENDPGARKSSKDAMIHALVGIIIILLIDSIIEIANGGTGMCG